MLTSPICITLGDDTLYKEPWKYGILLVSIREINPGFLWTPIVKRSKFTASGTCAFNGTIRFEERKKRKFDFIKLDGQLHVKGNISILGICSRATALQRIKDFIVSEIRKQLMGKLTSLNQEGLNYVPENED